MTGPAQVDIAALASGPQASASNRAGPASAESTPAESDAAARALCASLRETGFVVVTGHGIDPDLVARVQRGFAAFFALDVAQRRAYGGHAGGQRGYTPFGVERAVGQTRPDRKEFFHIGPERDAADAAHPANVWPSEVPEVRAASLALFAALERCAERLLVGIARGCGLPERSLAEMIRGGEHILRAAHYPARAPGHDPDALRAAAHEDINLITLLPAATDAGLEIRGADGAWHPVDAGGEGLVADAGDMLARVTAGAIPATTHRVVDPPGGALRSRLSLPFFAHPRPDCRLEVLAPFATPEACAAHPPIRARDFLAERLRQIGLVSGDA